MKRQVFMCAGCDCANMLLRHALQHNTRTGHRYLIQTPEALMSRYEVKARVSPEQIRMAVERVDHMLGDRLIDGTKHNEYCRCFACQKAFMDNMGVL